MRSLPYYETLLIMVDDKAYSYPLIIAALRDIMRREVSFNKMTQQQFDRLDSGLESVQEELKELGY